MLFQLCFSKPLRGKKKNPICFSPSLVILTVNGSWNFEAWRIPFGQKAKLATNLSLSQDKFRFHFCPVCCDLWKKGLSAKAGDTWTLQHHFSSPVFFGENLPPHPKVVFSPHSTKESIRTHIWNVLHSHNELVERLYFYWKNESHLFTFPSYFFNTLHMLRNGPPPASLQSRLSIQEGVEWLAVTAVA